MSLTVWSIITIPLYFVGAYLVAVLVRELVALRNMWYYKKQGVYCEYIPWLGLNYLIAKGKGTSDELGYWWKYV